MFFPFADNCQKHTMVCKACNSYVHNTNDMTLLHLNECFNGKFNDDHCSVYCVLTHSSSGLEADTKM